MNPDKIARRDLLRGGAAAMTAASYSRVLGANDKIQLGVIGPGDRGTYVMSRFQQNPSVHVAALCDVYAEHIDRAKQKAPDAKAFGDHRKMLEEKGLDVVLIATPDHWHATCAIDALNSGKDVYVEKPLTRKIEEGPPHRQSRAHQQPHLPGGDAAALRQTLLAGQARVFRHRQARQNHARPHLVARQQLSPAQGARLAANPAFESGLGAFSRPGEVARLGSAAVLQLARLSRFRRRPGDRPVHALDRRGAHVHGVRTCPKSASAAGGVYAYKDGRTAPDTINVLLQYPAEFTATFEATLVPGIRGEGVELCGTEGRLLIDRGHYEFHPAGKGAEAVVVKAEDPDMTFAHVSNFLECVRSRQRPDADVLIGHRSAQASHLGNIAYIERRRIDFDPQREEILPF